jgi:hypothetical protein
MPAQEQQIRTPTNQHELQEVTKFLEGSSFVPRKAASKIGKAAAIFHARAVIAETENQELNEEMKKMQEAAPRKRKRVPINGT